MKYPNNTMPFPAHYKFLYFICADKPEEGRFQKEHGPYLRQKAYMCASSRLLTMDEVRSKGPSDAQYYINVTPKEDVYTSIRFKDMVNGDYLIIEEGCRLNLEQDPKNTKQSIWPRSASAIYKTKQLVQRPLF